MGKPYRKPPDQRALEEEILDFWQKNRTFEKSIKRRENSPPFIFYEGPPTANGKPGIHHVISRTIKDIVCRYKTMTGHLVRRKAGWDTHGLPVELEVERSLGFSSKQEIIKFGVAEFNQLCRESVFRYKDLWEKLTRRIGYWLDMETPYITFTPEYIESVWYLLAQFFKSGLIYRGYKVVPFCPRCGTGLSDHEVAQGYRDTEDPSVFLKLPVVGEENCYFLVWTTTPWTLLSNVAIAVNPKYSYITAEYQGEKLILAKDRAEAVFEGEYRILDQYPGDTLSGKQYIPPFPQELKKKGYYVILADYVTVQDGTGIVHIAPAFGEEDFEEGKRYDLPMLQLVDESGYVKSGKFKGTFFKEADTKILSDLKSRKLILRLGKVVHAYPFCWRCNTPLMMYARSSWYIKTTAYKERMIELNSKINWVPKEIGSGRFGEWLKHNVDWAISRERFWGTPLNIWICEGCGKMIAIESLSQLRKLTKKPLPDDFDPHKPYIDEVVLRCPDCSADMHRTPEVIDCWFDSGSMPYSQLHYPFEHKEDFSSYFPADFISEGVDQTRGWFYTLLAISSFISGESCFKNVLVNELILDKRGQKMSKSAGNVVSPFEMIEKHGADPLRWYMITVSQPWLPTKFDPDGVRETSQKFFDTLKNTYSFFALYANIDGFNPKKTPKGTPALLDRWLTSRTQSLVASVRKELERFQLTRAARKIQTFLLDDLSNWYVRRSRKRFWSSGWSEDKQAAYHTLYQTLVTITKLIAPFIPMTADWYFKALTGRESVHLEHFPEPQQELINEPLENEMSYAVRIASVARAARNASKIKIRQPLSRMLVLSNDLVLDDDIKDILESELNIKSIIITSDRKELFSKKLSPNLRSLGPKFGKISSRIAELIKEADQETIETLLREKNINLDVNGKTVQLSIDDVTVMEEPHKGLSVASDGDITCAIDTTLTDALIREGIARELINRIQNTRKNAGFEVTDRVYVGIVAPEKIVKAASDFAEYIKRETLALELLSEPLSEADFSQKWNIYNSEVEIYLRKTKGGNG